MEFLADDKWKIQHEWSGMIGGADRNETVQVSGMVHAKRPMGGGFTFLRLRTREGVLQCTCSGLDLTQVPEESAVAVTGILRADPRAPGGVEL